MNKAATECYNELRAFRSHFKKKGEFLKTSKMLENIIKATADVSADDPQVDDGTYNKYIPSEIVHKIKCSRAKFLKGMQEVWRRVGETYDVVQEVTFPVMKRECLGDHEEWNYPGPGKVYYHNGGTVEQAFDAVLRIAQGAIKDGIFDELFEEQEREDRVKREKKERSKYRTERKSSLSSSSSPSPSVSRRPKENIEDIDIGNIENINSNGLSKAIQQFTVMEEKRRAELKQMNAQIDALMYRIQSLGY